MSQPSSSRPASLHKRAHCANGPRLPAAGPYPLETLPSYSPQQPFREPEASADDDAIQWFDDHLAEPSAPAAVPHPAQQVHDQVASSSSSVHRQLVNALRSNSAVRQTALRLLQRSQGQQHQQLQAAAQLAPAGLGSTQQTFPNQQQLIHQDVYTIAISAASNQTAFRYAHTGSSSNMLAAAQQVQQQHSPQRDVAAEADIYVPVARRTAQQAACNTLDDNDGVADWVNELEGQLLGCLKMGMTQAPMGPSASSNPSTGQHSMPVMAAPGLQHQQQRMHRHYHASSAQQQHQPYSQQQQGWAAAPMSAPSVGTAAHAGQRFSPSTLTPLQTFLGVDADSSPAMDPVGSASSSSNNSFGVARSGYNSSQTRLSPNTGRSQSVHSQPLPALGAHAQDQGWVHAAAGVKRHNSIDQDEVRGWLVCPVVIVYHAQGWAPLLLSHSIVC